MNNDALNQLPLNRSSQFLIERIKVITTTLCLCTFLISPLAASEVSLQAQAGIESSKHLKYLKRDRSGNPVPDNTKQWHCVEDTHNGLVWEVKSSDGGMRDKNNSYSWFQPVNEASPNQVHSGSTDRGRCSGNTDCDTFAYIQAINEQKFCGYSDWRLPTKSEMLSIVSLEKNTSAVTINNHYFPETLPSWYWTASSNKNDPEYAWYVLFRNGITLNDLKEHPKHIRLVRTDKKT